MKKLTMLCLSTMLSAPMLLADVVLVENGQPKGRIVCDTSAVNRQGAELLKKFVKRISGAELPIVKSGNAVRKNDVVIGLGDTSSLTEDGFRLKEDNGKLFISSGGDKGALYGVVSLLEDNLGVNYYGDNEYSYQPSKTIVLTGIDRYENPAFRYRQSQSYALSDPDYRAFMRFEEPADEFAGGYWVHTMNRLLPSDVYGKSHPEYYSYINGERRPGHASQWCLNNPEVLEKAVAAIDSVFKANPGRNMISVSQNDGNFTNCACELCAAVDSIEGSPSGNFVRFLNKLAERFPDKQFSTLAYLFTMHPPKVTKPLPNVNIMLCDIDCKREVPLTDNASGQDFMKALEGWSKISDNIFVWDYGINFSNTSTPFPNFPILQKNIQTFRDHHVKMHFSQIAGYRGGDFSEMRAWMVSKLMWNPEADSDSLMRAFMKDYYGEAAPYIYDYEKLLEGGLLASNRDLWIYDSPVSHKDGMLNQKLIKRYDELWDKAEKAVAGDSARLARVQRSRLPLQYSKLEIARSNGITDVAATENMLEDFRKKADHYGLKYLNENGNTPGEYCELFRTRYLHELGFNKARGAKINFIEGPDKKYAALGEAALTDELFGGSNFIEGWVGWEGRDGSFVVDLGKETEFSHVGADFLHQIGGWVLLPEKITVSISDDGKAFKEIGEDAREEDRTPSIKFVEFAVDTPAPVKARYVKMDVTGTKMCPSWHFGVGHPSWFFMDEVVVK